MTVVNLLNVVDRLAIAFGFKRVIILHNHLFKNAGSTIDWALQNNFGDTFVDHRDDDQMRKGESYLKPYLCTNKRIKALSSHHLTMPLPKIARTQLLSIIILRHPIERVKSVYNFEKNQISDTHPGVIHARKLPLKDYIEWRMKPEVGATIRNFQSRRMLPPRKIGQEKFTSGDIASLNRQIQHIEMIGLVHRFDECMVLFEEQLRKIYSKIDLSYIAQNVNQASSSLSLEAKLEQLKSEIGKETYELLIENNQQDLALFADAEMEIETRISKIKNFPTKLANFQDRCIAKAALISN